MCPHSSHCGKIQVIPPLLAAQSNTLSAAAPQHAEGTYCTMHRSTQCSYTLDKKACSRLRGVMWLLQRLRLRRLLRQHILLPSSIRGACCCVPDSKYFSSRPQVQCIPSSAMTQGTTPTTLTADNGMLASARGAEVLSMTRSSRPRGGVRELTSAVQEGRVLGYTRVSLACVTNQ